MLLDELFPKSPRVLFRRSPLRSVVCQVRFPPILKIEAETPAAFQEGIRADFPLFERGNMLPLANLPKPFLQALGGTTPVLFSFKSQDEQAVLNLAQDSLALTVNRYGRWEDFRSIFLKAIHMLREVYKPAAFARIGLRYQNDISLETLEVKGLSWSQLLNERLLGPMNDDRWLAAAVESRVFLRLTQDGPQRGIIFQHGFGGSTGSDKSSYIVDLDVYTEQQTDEADVEQTLDEFRARAGDAFRWCIREPLYDALGPEQC